MGTIDTEKSTLDINIFRVWFGKGYVLNQPRLWSTGSIQIFFLIGFFKFSKKILILRVKLATSWGLFAVMIRLVIFLVGYHTIGMLVMSSESWSYAPKVGLCGHVGDIF